MLKVKLEFLWITEKLQGSNQSSDTACLAPWDRSEQKHLGQQKL